METPEHDHDSLFLMNEFLSQLSLSRFHYVLELNRLINVSSPMILDTTSHWHRFWPPISMIHRCRLCFAFQTFPKLLNVVRLVPCLWLDGHIGNDVPERRGDERSKVEWRDLIMQACFGEAPLFSPHTVV